MCKPISKESLTLQPSLNIGSLAKITIKEPSASVNPVTKLGSSSGFCCNVE